MIKKYGKNFDIIKLNRSLSKLKDMAEESRKSSDRVFLSRGGTGCRVCGAQGGEFFLTVYSKYRYCECKECGSVYLDGLPDIGSMYNGDDNVNGDVYTDETYDERIRMIAIPKIDWVLDVCANYGIDIGNWIDIGCGGGEILQALKLKSIDGTGIESDKREYEFACKKGLKVRNLRVDYVNKEISELISSSSVISFFNVLEHIPDPKIFVDYLSNNMKPGSVLVFEVPRHPSLASFANYTGSQFIYRHIVPPIHLSIFSEKGIDYLLSDSFELLGKWYFGQGYMDIVNNAMLVSGLKSNQIYEEVLAISNKVQMVVDEQGLSDQIMVVARKRET